MLNIFLTGHTGFIGKYFQKKFSTIYNFTLFDKIKYCNKNDLIYLHLAGKAHDLKKADNFNLYYEVNTELTKNVFDQFLKSNAKVFITLSTVKAVADRLNGFLTEDSIPNPITHYGKSKLLAEQYILSMQIPEGKRVYILRPCMIHGPGNKGNLNLLYLIISKGFPWPLGAFDNKRSFCSIDNLCFIINELIDNDRIPSGVYNIADNDPVSTNELITLIAKSQNTNFKIWNIPKTIIIMFSKLGDLFRLPLNTERLNKLTETYIVSNQKIIKAMNKPLPINSKDGLLKTFDSFNK
jgi:nucleoside-diphosphate-sugar epimerase